MYKDSSVSEHGIVVLYASKGHGSDSHEKVTQCELARRVASLKGCDYAGDFDAACHYAAPLYFVPGDTIDSVALADRLGIHGEQDLFGGVVPFPFVAMKTITHPLVDEQAQAPVGWSPAFGLAVNPVVLPGYSAFGPEDALVAGERLLPGGTVRIKKASGIGGTGQWVIRNPEELRFRVLALQEEGAYADGVVLERNLNDIATLSVGQVRIGTALATYHGVQYLTRNNDGVMVYGGSELVVVRGGFDELLQLELDDKVRLAVAQARVYHGAALSCFRGMFASRSNYDIAQGMDDTGHWHSGVLEQSWRAGGASGAELVALAAFREDPSLPCVRACTTEVYGHNAPVPDDAVLYYHGNDVCVGPITKYARLKSYGSS